MQCVLHSFRYSIDFLHEQLAAVTDRQMHAQPAGVRNHPAWIVGHLVHTCQLLGELAGLKPWLDESWIRRYGTGSAPHDKPDLYESKEDLLAALQDATERIARAAGSMDESALDAVFPAEHLRDVFPTVRHAFTHVLTAHTAYHVGQVSVWRSAMGLKAMGRDFE
jgi:hypothetical protein